MLEKCCESSDDSESYDSSSEDLFIVDNNRNDRDSRKDGYSDGATSTSTSTSTTSSEAQTSSAQSLLDVLKAPPRSSLSRKRTIARNPPRGKRKSRGSSTNDPKSVKPAQRVKEYQDEPFTVSNCKLFCMGCREEIYVKKSSIENHLRSLKHRKGKERLKQKELKEISISKSLEKYNNQVHPKGETLPPSQQVFRVKHF